ncbi:hypothetical protein LC608_30135 [Nostoc sp. XA010]|uniref:hypothetical protein n=1 Tax=Nostoc sp. XA010 TaxID=2780407 RepID=UPI001E486C46|nr:hypothetical protein [Nostoc sp. XA010]MCC5661149.1 hypothetical protein [Nostoc sp. XA010]
MTNENPQTEYDSPWKQILQLYFQDFMQFFFPQAHGEIDWSRGNEFLDKELQPVIKLVDYQQRQSELEVSRNPFATVVMAHLKAIETRDNRIERKQQKLVLVRRLYEQGFEQEDIINLFGFIDWMLSLPIELEQEFWQEIRNFEESKRMQYITSVEQIGFQKGIEQSQNQIKQVLLKSISLGLKLKFGETDQNLLAEIEAIQDTSVLETILEAIDTASTVSQLRQIYQLPATDMQPEV